MLNPIVDGIDDILILSTQSLTPLCQYTDLRHNWTDKDFDNDKDGHVA